MLTVGESVASIIFTIVLLQLHSSSTHTQYLAKTTSVFLLLFPG